MKALGKNIVLLALQLFGVYIVKRAMIYRGQTYKWLVPFLIIVGITIVIGFLFTRRERFGKNMAIVSVVVLLFLVFLPYIQTVFFPQDSLVGKIRVLNWIKNFLMRDGNNTTLLLVWAGLCIGDLFPEKKKG